MTQQKSEKEFAEVVALLHHYRFDCDRSTIETLVVYWCVDYSLSWVKLAVVEALYQGRYKSLSVEQILQGWQRRNQPTYHFSHEFERLIHGQLPARETISPEPLLEEIATLTARLKRTKPQGQKLEPNHYTIAQHPIDKFVPDAKVDVEEISRKFKTTDIPKPSNHE
jgi:hypothetical protein